MPIFAFCDSFDFLLQSEEEEGKNIVHTTQQTAMWHTEREHDPAIHNIVYYSDDVFFFYLLALAFVYIFYKCVFLFDLFFFLLLFSTLIFRTIHQLVLTMNRKRIEKQANQALLKSFENKMRFETVKRKTWNAIFNRMTS